MEVIQDYGYSFKVKDKQDLADKLGSLLSNPTMTLMMEAKIKEMGRSKYTWDYISKEYDAVYRGVGLYESYIGGGGKLSCI